MRNPKANNRFDPIYTYTWDIQQLFAGNGFGHSPSTNIALIYLKECTLPTFTVSKERVKGANLEYKFASGVVWEDVKVVWYDTRGLLKTMQEWRESIWTPEFGLTNPQEYKQQTYINVMSADAELETTWVLENSWPSMIRHGQLTYTSSDVKVVEVTITYDWAKEFKGD